MEMRIAHQDRCDWRRTSGATTVHTTMPVLLQSVIWSSSLPVFYFLQSFSEQHGVFTLVVPDSKKRFRSPTVGIPRVTTL